MTLEDHRRNPNGGEVGHDVLDRMGIACMRVTNYKFMIWHRLIQMQVKICKQT